MSCLDTDSSAVFAMVEIDNSSPPRRPSRDQRLAEALRANLKRRKAQVRGRATAEPDGIDRNVQDGAAPGGHPVPGQDGGNGA